MSNGKKSAYPQTLSRQSGDGKVALIYSEDGVTKREYFAGLAMQGLLTAPNSGKSFDSLEALTKASVFCADIILKELEETAK